MSPRRQASGTVPHEAGVERIRQHTLHGRDAYRAAPLPLHPLFGEPRGDLPHRPSGGRHEEGFSKKRSDARIGDVLHAEGGMGARTGITEPGGADDLAAIGLAAHSRGDGRAVGRW